MKEYKNVYSLTNPTLIEVTNSKVFLVSNLHEEVKKDERDIEKQFYVYDLTEYTINEYLVKLQEEIIKIQNILNI